MLLTCAVSLAVACGDDSVTGGGNTGGSGGTPDTGGQPGTGGDPSNGGQPGTGGDPSNGGQPGTGGDPSNGGGPSNGGSPGTGGDPGTGGGVSAAECTTECEEAQAGKCAPFEGSCADCCGAAAEIPGCDAQANALYACYASAPTPCEADCTDEAMAAQTCIQDYCFANLADPNCGTLFACAG
jgi:hypothetical protein